MLRTAAILCLAWLAGCGADPTAAPTPDTAARFASIATMAAAPTGPRPAATARAARGAPKPLPPGVLILQRTTIVDPGVMKAGSALSVLVPAAWRL